MPERIAFARRLRRDATPAERKLWQCLRKPPFNKAKFRRQVPVGPYTADFLSHSMKLVIEADGSQHGGSPNDRRRDRWFEAQGWQVLRIPNREVTHNWRGVMELLLLRLQDRSGV